MDEMEEVFESVARYFLILSEPARLRILHCICQQERSVGQIVEETGLTQSNASRHLNMMYQAGVLRRRRDGAQVLYGVTDTTLTDVCRAVCVRVSAELDGNKGLKRSFRDLISELR
jgi:DNA-binding transcriptional ArsR family regulator